MDDLQVKIVKRVRDILDTLPDGSISRRGDKEFEFEYQGLKIIAVDEEPPRLRVIAPPETQAPGTPGSRERLQYILALLNSAS